MYDISVNAEGKVLEVSNHAINRDLAPKGVIAAYEKWNSKGLKGMVTEWTTEVGSGKGRVYRVTVLMSQVKFYAASINEVTCPLKTEPERMLVKQLWKFSLC